MAETLLEVILRCCTGGVLLSLPTIAFRLLREVFFRRDLVAYLVSHGVQFPLTTVGYTFCLLLPPALVRAAWPRLCLSSPSPCPTEIPGLCLRVVPLHFPPRGFPSGQVSCLLPLKSFPSPLPYLVPSRVLGILCGGVLPCLGCKYVRIIHFSV